MTKKKDKDLLILDNVESARTIISLSITAESLIKDAMAIERCTDIEKARILKLALDVKMKLFDKYVPTARETEADRKGKRTKIIVNQMDTKALEKLIEDNKPKGE